jgi:hypothetical protein
MGVLEPRSRGLRTLAILAGTLAVLLAACAGSQTAMQLSPVGAPIDGGRDAAAATVGPVPAGAGGELPAVGQAEDNPPSAPKDDLRIVYTGSLQLVVDDLQAALAKAKAAVAATGGYIGASQESSQGDRPVATITYRIPASRWDGALDALRGLAAKVVSEETQATEVGGQIVDLEARIRNLRASEASLQEIAKGTGKVSDLLEVEAQLTQVRGEIEQLDGQRARLADQVAYGTLVTTFGTEVVAVTETAKGWDPLTDVDSATATLIGAGQTLVSIGIWFVIVWLPLIAVLVLLALVGRWLFRRFVPAGQGGSGAIPGWGEGAGGS